jgi:hypothetical protein
VPPAESAFHTERSDIRNLSQEFRIERIQAVRLNATDPDSLQSLYRRTYADVPLLPPLENKAELPQQKVIPFRNDLKILDAALKKGGAANG